ncbi:MAG: hypothetical protein ACOVOV_18775 [Dolichospermum sp.]
MVKKSKTTATTPAISRLLGNIQPFYRKIDVDLILRTTAKTRRKWEGFLIDNCDDFANYFKPNHGLNFYQVVCLCFISDWKFQFPSISDEQLIEMINQNSDQFSLNNAMKFTSKQSPKKTTQLVKVA